MASPDDPIGVPPGRPSQLRAGAALSYVSMVLGFVIAMAYTPIVLRLLGQSEYGLFTLVVSLVGYLGLAPLGLTSAYMRLHARYRAAADALALARLNAMFLIVLSGLGVAVLAGGLLLAAYAEVILGSSVQASEIGTSRALFSLLSVGVAVSMPLAVFEFQVIAAERFVFQKVLIISRNLLVPIAVLPLLYAGYGSVAMASAIVVANFGAQVYTTVFCYRSLGMRFAFHGMRVSVLREVIVFSSYVFVGVVVDQINWNVDKYLIGLEWGTAPVAVYAIASLLVMYFMSLSAAVSGVFTPRIHQMIAAQADDHALTLLFARVGRIQFVLLAGVLVVFVLFGQPFILLWAGQEYGQSYVIALVLMIPVTVPLIQNLGIEIQRAKNRHRFRSWVYLAIAAGNVIGSILLIREIGPVGAAVGTAASLLIGNGLVMNWYYSARLGLDMRYFWSEIMRLLPAVAPAILVGLAFALSLDTRRPPNLISGVLLVGLTYCMAMWRFGLDADERALIRIPPARARWLRRGPRSRGGSE